MKHWFGRNRERKPLPERREPVLSRSDRRMNLRSFRGHGSGGLQLDPREAFDPYKPPKGVRGYAPEALAMDSGNLEAVADMGGWAATAAPVLRDYFEDGLAFLGYPQLAQMAQRAEYRKPCEVIAREATREWIEFRSDKQGADVDENDGAAKRIAEIEKEFERLNVRRVIRTHVLHGLLYGLGHVWIGIKGVPLTTDGQSVPLVIGDKGMAKGSLERLANIEPIWTTPNSYNANNPLAPDFYRPNNWWVLGTMVDSSRLLTTILYPVSQILAPAFNFGGQSLTQLLRAYVHNYLATRNSTATIVRNFSKLVLKTDMTGNIQTDIGPGMDAQPMPYGDVDMASVQGRAAYMQDVSEGQGTIVVDKEREDASIIATPLSGLDSLQAQAMEAMASIPGIPLVKLFGIQPQGLNASSEGEIRVFYDEVSAFQEAHIRPSLQRIFEAVQIHLWGKIDPDLSFTFVPLWQMDEKELAEIEKIKADLVALLITAGVIAPEEAREQQATDERSIFRGVNLSGPPPEPPEPEQMPGMEDLLKKGEEEE
ncbi:phage portal protein [Gluconobacter kanchanaburiensis]|uniref:Anti-CBASS protein Acb1-like N-terminal domain-containing protein n=1 Tax=Gluconobacter kanchanaburiensis NBRC 103587 TaxID=1307948 RepID=A0A511B648_9PROT|nr:DUF1073 domain-containing protein [Gluconobacter kanchanaburiensis]MBF0861267.1 DUF1073 domain-containing protein [Gluconobacter kanchanaburiensis]GBR70982.1 hypothetical protein AA103587_2157 [Gluconobacter kanchanaburiensis NBRC 103587]GEK95906.1 hypothetical protein GKA01_11030 [Gluconobacter kanchanaburiensis NBRC 103587]